LQKAKPLFDLTTYGESGISLSYRKMLENNRAKKRFDMSAKKLFEKYNLDPNKVFHMALARGAGILPTTSFFTAYMRLRSKTTASFAPMKSFKYE